jgi:ribosomal protein L11 methyltransferase
MPTDTRRTAEPRFPQLLVDVDEAEGDAASGVLFDVGASGIEERDATTLARGAPGKVTLVASFDDEPAAREALAALRPEWSPRVEVIAGDAFRDEWKKFFHPFVLCPGVVVHPPWEAYAAGPGERVLTLEPGRAFGTGLHETTSLVADALLAHPHDVTGADVLDVGCGSGILSLLALSLGAARARGVDVDPEAAEVMRENAVRNGCSGRLEADTTDVRDLGGAYGVVLANIEARVLVPLAGAIMARTSPGGLLVLSGILAPDVAAQLEDVKAAYAAFTLEAVERKGEWLAVLLRAPRDA